ncbi:MAG: hypothetical protein JWQ33_472, partial [Ramlibacter sp.]|nr:hypothetical protein [Ramlibacter sp.]
SLPLSPPHVWASMRRAFSRCAIATVCSLVPMAANAYLVTITAGTKAIFLQVGTGTMTGGTFNNGGTPGNNGTVNVVSVTVPASSLGTGPLAMTPNVTVPTSPWDGYNFCPMASPVYIGGFYRGPGGGSANLTVKSAANLVSGANNISFSTISWVSSGAGDAVPTLPSGTFVAGTTQTLRTIPNNNWFESCFQFTYANATAVPAGTFTGQAVYTLTAP